MLQKMLLPLAAIALMFLPVFGTGNEDVILVASTSNSTSKLDSYIEDNHSWCPSPKDIQPCSCEGPQRFMILECDRITDVYSITHAVRTVQHTGKFGKFSLTNARIQSLETNILGYLKFEYIFLRKNTVTKIGKEFFESSKDTLKRIEIVHNDVEKFPFKELSTFPKLQYINLKYNSIKSIPDDAFGTTLNDQIRKIDLSFNKINHIGSNAFKYLTRLDKIDLRFNKLTVINNLAFAAIYENYKLTVHLGNNKIMYVADGAFQNQVFKNLNLTDNNLTTFQEKAFRDVLKKMAERRTGTIAVKNNRFRCSCDKMEWIIRLPTLYKLPILDFECIDKNTLSIQDMTLRDVGCKTV